jgi:hypothetical protein
VWPRVTSGVPDRRWRIEERELTRARRLEVLVPSGKLVVGDGRSTPYWFSIAPADPVPPLFEWHVKIVKLDSGTERSGSKALFVSVLAEPEPGLQDHALSEGQEVLAELPEEHLESGSDRFVMQVDAELQHPRVPIQPNRWNALLERSRERGLPGSRQSRDQEEPGPHETILSPTGSRCAIDAQHRSWRGIATAPWNEVVSSARAQLLW